MADDLLRPLGANIPSLKTLKAGTGVASPTTQATTLQETRSTVETGAAIKDGDDEERRDVAAAKVALPAFQPVDEDLAQAIKRIGRAVERLLKRLDRLEDRVERAAARFEADLSRDIRRGNFEDRTPDRAVSRLLARLDRIEGRAERISERFYQDLSRAIGRQDKGGLDQAGISVEVSQSLTLSVERLELNLQGEDGEISVSYQRIAFSISTSVGLAVALPGQAANDAEGRPADIASADSGLFLAPDLPEAITRQGVLRPPAGEDGGAANDNSEAEETTATLPADPANAPGFSALLLLQEFNVSSGFEVQSLVLNAGARFGPTLQGNPLAVQPSGAEDGGTRGADPASGLKLNI